MEQSDLDVKRALLVSVPAGSAFLATTWLDSRLSSHPFNDVKLLGQMFITRSPWWQVQGLLGHYGFSALVSLLYAAWGYGLLPGPPWFRGVLFLQIENAALYPIALVVDRIHAGMRRGELAPLLDWKTFWGQVLRHVAFGLVLGVLYRPKGHSRN
jgi:hypothetical protein